MAVRAHAASAPAVRRPSGLLVQGIATAYLSIIVLLPLAAVAAKAFEDGLAAFWDQVTAPEAVAAL